MIDKPKDNQEKEKGGRCVGLVVARLHLLSDVSFGEEITISYIPTSGLGFQERQQRLREGYEFICRCQACTKKQILLPSDADVDSIRQIQFTCNEKLLLFTQIVPNFDDIEQIISLVEMTKRGISNQTLPHCHELSIEADRLLAIANTLLGKKEAAIQNHISFFSKTNTILHLFDPVCLASQRVKYARLLDEGGQQSQMKQAISELEAALGLDHPWILSLKDKSITVSHTPVKKKQKVSC
jgi:hypothetical protein